MTTCTLCPQEATLVEYVHPALCDDHQVAVLIVGLLYALNLPITAGNVRKIAIRFPKIGLSPDQVVELCRPLIDNPQSLFQEASA